MNYVELQIASAFSFLRGASLPIELVATAKAVGHAAIGIADRNTVAGVVQMHDAARQQGMRLLPGARLVFRDGTPDLLCYPRDRAAWGRLTRLLTCGKMRVAHGDMSSEAKRLNRCFLDFADLEILGNGQAVLAVPSDMLDADFRIRMQRLRARFPDLLLAISRRHRGDDARRLRCLAKIGASMGVALAAVNDVLYHLPERRPLQDALTAVRLGCRVDQAGLALQPNAERYLKPAQEMLRLFRSYPEAIARSLTLLDLCQFTMSDLSYHYPDEPVPPGMTPDTHLAALVAQGGEERFPDGIPYAVCKQIDAELEIIKTLNYACYFLTVHDIVRYARNRGILCQGRGSAANSAVCYCLGVTAINPFQGNLLFERFMSAERQEPPDIDVDFEHERREEIIQYVYARYGRHRAGIVATVIHYRPKTAIRDVGKAMGVEEDTLTALAGLAGHFNFDIRTLWTNERLSEMGLDPASASLQQSVELAKILVRFPRHLSQHVGGFVLTKDRLDETVPIGNASMMGRSFIEWDKNDIDTLGIMKVDVLALGMLTCIRKAFNLVGLHDLAYVPQDDPAVYDMLSRGDSVGVFQVESRAQMNMLPRLRPKKFYDLVIEVAIVRPGPIQGDMVHPYLRRRQDLEPVDYPSPASDQGAIEELKEVLDRTLGVPLFQEQAMRIAILAAQFSGEEANQLRRAMATFRTAGTIDKFKYKMINGMVARGYTEDFARRCFRQIEGFGTYGFPESHAASFAVLVYVSAWLKCHHPACFACALLNAQPMGFYAPAQIIGDAREHGVSVRGVDVTASVWDCTIESGSVLRLGLCLISGFQKEWAAQLIRARAAGRLHSLADFAMLGLPQAARLALADADALQGLGTDRRTALWHAQGHPDAPPLPLFTASEMTVPLGLSLMEPEEVVVADYRATGLSLRAHPLRFLRHYLSENATISCSEAVGKVNGSLVHVAGVVLVRQRPGNGKVVFCTIEDETGTANIVIWASLFEAYQRVIVGARLLLVIGRLQRSLEGVVHVVAEHMEDKSPILQWLVDPSLPKDPAYPSLLTASSTSKHPPNERVFPVSRDFR